MSIWSYLPIDFHTLLIPTQCRKSHAIQHSSIGNFLYCVNKQGTTNAYYVMAQQDTISYPKAWNNGQKRKFAPGNPLIAPEYDQKLNSQAHIFTMKMHQSPGGWSNTIADTSSLNACMYSASKLFKVNSHKRKDFNMVCETHYYQKPSLWMSCYQINFEDNLLCYKKLAQVENSGPALTVIEVTELLIKI